MSHLYRKPVSVLLCVFLSLGQAAPVFADDAVPPADPAVPSAEIIVKFRRDAINVRSTDGLVAAAKLGRDAGLIESETAPDQNLALFVVRDASNVNKILGELRSNPDVERVEKNFKLKPAAFPSNDPLGGELWGLHNIGQTVNGVASASGADIKAPSAWAINEGTHAPVVVAVIDTGVRIDHEDLQNSLWDGSQCVDDSGNALGGCQHGYDFADDDTDPSPSPSDISWYHGTHVAGIIAAEKNNGKGGAGVAPHAKIMAIRFDFTIFSLVRAINFARHNGAKVINASFGGFGFSQNEFDAFKAFTDGGGLVAAAAGNNGASNDVTPFYPASFNLPNLISVAATTQTDGLASFSNRGTNSVHVGAPGVNIMSTSVTTVGEAFLSEDFDAVGVQSVPTNWLRSGTMGVAVSPHFTTKGLAGDAFQTPYAKNGSGTVTLPALNLTGTQAKALNFNAACDTQFAVAYTDYMMIEYSTGGAFTELARFDEFDVYHGNSSNDGLPRNLNANVPDAAKSSATVLRFRWITNGDNDTGTNGDGCMIDDLHIVDLVPTDHYEFLSGTSMASPHVAGEAALLMGYNPALTTTDVNNIILGSGDDLGALAGQTIRGKRINLERAMHQADAVPPIITLTGNSSVSIAQGLPYTDSGATAVDTVDGDVTSHIVTVNPVNTAVIGTYTIHYNVSDAAGNAAAEVTRTVDVINGPDTTPPVITLLGLNPFTINLDQTFTDPGATASDNIDGNLTSSIVVTGAVDTHTVGTYTLFYNVSDAAGNPALEVTRTVTVLPPPPPDTTPPVITLLGDNPKTVLKDQPFTDSGAIASDNQDGDLTSQIVVTGSVDTHTVGTYTLFYNVSDAAGNAALEVTRTVDVIDAPDTTPPVITLLGSSGMTATQDASFTDPGATASDAHDGDLTANIVVTGSVNTHIPGEYILRYNVSDAAGNAATERIRTVTVVSVATPPAVEPSQPVKEEGNHAHDQGSGGGRGSNYRMYLKAIAILKKLHTPEGIFDSHAPTLKQISFLCSIRHMTLSNDVPTASLIDGLSQEIESTTGIPHAGAEAFLEDAHACDGDTLARQTKTQIVQAPKPVLFPIADDGYPISNNPTWNACVRDDALGNIAIIRANPDRDPETGRAYSCDHYSNAHNSWHHPDLNVDFTLVPAIGGRRPVVSIPHGYMAVGVTGQTVAAATLTETATATPDSQKTAGSAKPTDALTDIRTAEEERRLQKNGLSVDGVEVRNVRQTEGE